MELIASALVILVAVLHLYFMVLQMFLWQKPKGLKTFRMDAAKAATTSTLAANQGLYNGFLAVGLIWGVLRDNLEFQLFFLVGIIVVGIYGAITANPRIFWFQALPAILAIIAVYMV